MKNLARYIFEKFKIGKDISDQSLVELLDKALDEEYVKTLNSTRRRYTDRTWKDIDKMREYHNKGSKPQRLVNSIKDGVKLLNRFDAAVQMKWEEAINIFGQAIIDRGIWTEDEVVKFISIYYKK